MRIWDISSSRLCRQHLLGEHRELHAIWSILVNLKKGYSHHPEVLRWKGKLKALYKRHEALCTEILSRGYNHKSPLDKKKVEGSRFQKEFIDSLIKQKHILKNKRCNCKV
ncbi:MAG: pyrimidine dimer DNA glycosylase/endonuclease V [Candidatus Gygaella obscura]|nr:pyrimidine dimer DNA glycosylase/endonuclease V [Candidatus Gygaella obscura]